MDTETDMASRHSFVFRAHNCSWRGAWCARTAGFRSCVHVQGLAGEREVRFADRLRLGWMRVDELGHVRWLRVPVVDQLAFGDELAHPGPDKVHAEHRSRLAGRVLGGGGDDLRRPLRLQDNALAVPTEVVGELCGVDAALRGHRGGDTYRGDLWVAVGDPRHPVVVDRRDLEPSDALRDHDPLGKAVMRELRAGDEVTHRGDRRDVGPAVFVDPDDAAPAECALQELRARLLLGWQQVGQHLDDRDFRAERAPHAGELHADDAAAENYRRPGHVVEPQGVVTGNDPVAVDFQARQAPRLRPGGQHHVSALVDGVADADLCRRDEASLAVDDLDLAAGERALQALPQSVDDLVLVGVDAWHVHAIERRPDPESLAVSRQVGDLRRVQERLGRDAPAVQASAADPVLLDEGDPLAKFGRAERARVAAATATEDHDVVGTAAFRHQNAP